MDKAKASFRILLVDDEPAIRDLVAAVLEGEGVEVRCVPGGAQAVKEALQARPDLVLLDIVLPDLDGLAVCRVLRAHPALREVPIYMLTARVRKADREAAKGVGATGYIEKPFTAQRLEALVSRLRDANPGQARR